MMSLKGQKNVYRCHTCGKSFVTVDRDGGGAPFMTGCRAGGCKGAAESAFDPVDQTLEPQYEWYRPTDEEAAAKGRNAFEQHRKGGLFLREISKGGGE